MLRRRLLKHQEDDTAVRDAKVRQLRGSLGPLSGRHLKFCSDACLRRYLDAQTWDLDKAQKMLEGTLKWRSNYKPEEIRWHEVEHEADTGKIIKANFHDKMGRNILIMRPGKQNTRSPEGNVRLLVYLMENVILNLSEGQEQMSWLIDLNGWSLNNNCIKTARDINHILQNQYPDRLAMIVLYNPPRIFEAFWKVVKYFVDRKMFERIKFVYPNNKDSSELMKTFFDAEKLPSEFGGKATLRYDHEEFSRLMVEDEAKTAAFWGMDYSPFHDTKPEVASEPGCVKLEF